METNKATQPCHLPLDRLVSKLLTDADDEDVLLTMANESNPWFCSSASMLMPMCAGVSSGSGVSPARYCMTCLMLGLTPASGCEHVSPTLNANLTSSTLLGMPSNT
jgi:hypothetical protein